MEKIQKTVHLPEEHVAYLEELADANDTSFNAQVRAAIEYAIDQARKSDDDEDTRFRRASLQFRKRRLEEDLECVEREMESFDTPDASTDDPQPDDTHSAHDAERDAPSDSREETTREDGDENESSQQGALSW